ILAHRSGCVRQPHQDGAGARGFRQHCRIPLSRHARRSGPADTCAGSRGIGDRVDGSRPLGRPSAATLTRAPFDLRKRGGRVLKQTVDADATHAAARLNAAEQRGRQGDIASAIDIVEKLVAETPQLWWVREKLGELYARANRFSEAATHFREAAERKQNDPSLLYKWSRATFDAGDPAQAKIILDRAARFAPSHEAILRLYAEIFEGAADWENLGRIAEFWLRTRPQNPLPWMCAARAQWETGYLTQAMQSYRAFLERGGKSATSLATFGRLCLTALAYDDASRALDEAERLDPQCAHMLSATAKLSMFRGQFGQAQAYARKAIKVNPDDAAAFRVLVQVSEGGIAEQELAELRRLSEKAEMPAQERIAAAFALADCLDAREETDAAFAAYERANQLSAARASAEGFRYDRVQRSRQTEQLIAAFPIAPKAIEAQTRPTPIFIVGMPRSGTTLVESILGAHSKVFACGERQAMRGVMQEFTALETGISAIAAATRPRWRASYVRELPALGGATAISDKKPWD